MEATSSTIIDLIMDASADNLGSFSSFCLGEERVH